MQCSTLSEAARHPLTAFGGAPPQGAAKILYCSTCLSFFLFIGKASFEPRDYRVVFFVQKKRFRGEALFVCLENYSSAKYLMVRTICEV